jgi:2'-5' RNA ligase
VKFARDPRRLRSAVEPLAEEDFGAVACDEATVYTSELGPEGPTYTAVARAPLGG